MENSNSSMKSRLEKRKDYQRQYRADGRANPWWSSQPEGSVTEDALTDCSITSGRKRKYATKEARLEARRQQNRNSYKRLRVGTGLEIDHDPHDNNMSDHISDEIYHTSRESQNGILI